MRTVLASISVTIFIVLALAWLYITSAQAAGVL